MEGWLNRGQRGGFTRISFEWFCTLCSILILSSCNGCSLQWAEQDDAETFTFLSYNVHNLFDDRDDGGEYPEYSVAEGRWNRTQYLKKLENLARVVRESSPGGADFLGLYEIENQRVLKDLIDLYLPRMGYREYTAVGTDKSGIRIGFITRLPVSSCTVHQPLSMGFPQRPVLELVVDCGGNPLWVFLCHFKSKREGAEATERNRVAAAEVVRKRVQCILEEDGSREILILGDLNENIDEYERVGGRYPTALVPMEEFASEMEGLVISRDPKASGNDDGSFVFYSPWFDETTGTGSYWYQGNWETIDHVLISPNLLRAPDLVYSRFQVVTLPYLLKDSGQPDSAYSDHLPLWVEFVRHGE
ncbi:MAG: endonuclease [Spirochaetales bacterium]